MMMKKMKTAHLPSPTQFRRNELLGKLQITKTMIKTTMMIRIITTKIRTTVTIMTIKPTTIMTVTGPNLLHHSEIAKIFRQLTGFFIRVLIKQVAGAIHQQ
jgi:hypothetical protein